MLQIHGNASGPRIEDATGRRTTLSSGLLFVRQLMFPRAVYPAYDSSGSLHSYARTLFVLSFCTAILVRAYSVELRLPLPYRRMRKASTRVLVKLSTRVLSSSRKSVIQ